MLITQIQPIEYGGRVPKTATKVGVYLSHDNLVDSLIARVTIYSETGEGLETMDVVIDGKEYQDLDTHNGIDINEEILRLVLKKTDLKKLVVRNTVLKINV